MTLVLEYQDFNGTSRILNLPAPVNATEPATKQYVDNAIEGLTWKDDVRVSPAGNVNLTSPGATIDGVTLTVGDRILLFNQSNATENGIYTFNGGGVSLTRALDANSASDLNNAVTNVNEGTNAGATFRQTAVNPVVGTSALQFQPFGVGAPAATTTTAGTLAIASQAEVDAGAVTNKAITPQTLANQANRRLSVSAVIGDGTANQFTITHNFGTRKVHVSVYRNATPWDTIKVNVERPTLNTVVVRFDGYVPPVNSFEVLVGN